MLQFPTMIAIMMQHLPHFPIAGSCVLKPVVVFNRDELEHEIFGAQNITMDTARKRL